MLAKNFGLKVNGEAFTSLANSFDFSIVRKLQHNPNALEALFFGQSGLLEVDIQDVYFSELKSQYKFLKQKFGLENQGVIPLQFFRLRPSNFPTIRLSQLANLYFSYRGLFSKLIQLKTKQEFYNLLNIQTTLYWESHYTFSKASKKTKKKLSKSFIDLLIINTIIPIKFAYSKVNGNPNVDEVFDLIKSLKIENNAITNAFLKLKSLEKNALTSQSVIQLKNEYCNKNKCLQCAVGNSLILKKA